MVRRANIVLRVVRAWVALARSPMVALLMIVGLGWAPGTWALGAGLDVSQYAHTAWKIRDGFSKGIIKSIAQTPDGYLWLGTEFGLLRFDGVHGTPWQLPGDANLAGTDIPSLLVTRDGTLWIGTTKGLASWKDGKLTQHPELAGEIVVTLLEDREGTVWVGTVGSSGRLCAILGKTAQCYGQDGSFGQGVSSLYEDSGGNLWAGGTAGLWRWKPGPPKHYLVDSAPAISAMVEDGNGALLINTRVGIRQIVYGKVEAFRVPGAGQQFTPSRLIQDRDGSLWIGTLDRGLLHVHEERTDVFTQSDGLSGDSVTKLFEDREGNIWVATLDGLDRFRDLTVTTIAAKQGLSGLVGSVLAARDDSVWLGTQDGLKRWNNGQITIYRKRSAQPSGPLGSVREITGSGLPDDSVESLFQDDGGQIWVSTYRGLAHFWDGQFAPVGAVPPGFVLSIAGDSEENLWVSNRNKGLFHLQRGSVVEQIPWARLGRKDTAVTLLADVLHGGLWLGFHEGGVAYFKDGQVRESYSSADGLGAGDVMDLRFDSDGTLWAATQDGLSRVKNGHVATLSSKNGLPCDTVHWSMEDDSHSVWLYMACGLARIARPELDAWVTESTRKIQLTVFDSSDGVRSHGTSSGYSPRVAKTSDGKLWFLPWDGVSVIDPRHLPFNKLPPPVHIEQIIADHETYWQNWAGDAVSLPSSSSQPRLPPLVRDLTIDYTALSLVVPEKVRFRYKLEGWDRDWQDAGTRRQAFYTNLSPRKYRFRVMACNNSGVWSEAGDTLDFSIAPTYYQTTWFRLSCVLAFLALFWALYQLRLRQVARQFNMRLEERVGERTRIARELHDTLLQSFQGLLLRFQAATNLLPGRPEDAQKTLESAIEQAARAITEGRDAVQGLRSSTKVANDLSLAISALSEELGCGETNPNCAEFNVEVEGTPRDLHPILRDEVYRLAGEAVRNAFKHAEAERVEVEIRYGERELRVRVRDDGKGIDAKLLNEGGRPGHYGLRGMRERAKLMGGKLAVWSEADAGTEVELRIPASRAYEASSSRGRSWLAEKFSGKDAEMKS